MTKISKIMVPFDDTMRSIRALEYAAMFASGTGFKITALHIADPKNYHTKEEFNHDLEEMMNNRLRPKLAEIHNRYSDIRKIDLQIRGMDKSIPQHILDFAEEDQTDFIVMRSHGLTQAGDWELHFKSTNAYKVLLEAHCPVFTFTQVPDSPQVKNILVPLDLSHGSLNKLPFAITLAKRFKAKLHLVTSSEYQDDYTELNDQINSLYCQLSERGLNVVKDKIFSGTLPDAILSYCETHPIDLVIIMSRPGFRWSDIWVSPKAKRIVSWSKVPVVSLRLENLYEDGL